MGPIVSPYASCRPVLVSPHMLQPCAEVGISTGDAGAGPRTGVPEAAPGPSDPGAAAFGFLSR